MELRRRDLLAMPALMAAGPSTDVRIEGIDIAFEDFLYRAPYMFGGREVDRVTMLNVRCRVQNRAGKSAEGYAAMSMGNAWAFPAPDISYDTTLLAMRTLAERLVKVVRGYKDYGHPLDANHALEPQFLKAAEETSREMGLPRPIPKLCTLVTASPLDAAIHDAYGRLQNRNSFSVCGRDFVRYDLSHYLGADFKGEYLDRYVRRTPVPKVRMYHSVGASDPLTQAEVKKRIGDGLPETLEDWIPYSGVVAVKIKLNGGNLAADVSRVLAIDRVTSAAQAKRGVNDWLYCLDFNERCPDVKYLLEFVRQVTDKAPKAFERAQYIEQPTARDLAADRKNTMFEAAKLKPVVIDESLTDLETLLLAREMGYTGVALKACKGQSQTLLMAAAAQKYKMFRCVQDLTCPGAALIHSVGIAARIPDAAAVEANARQYVPSASKAWGNKFPGIFNVRDGFLHTAGLNGPGLCTNPPA